MTEKISDAILKVYENGGTHGANTLIMTDGLMPFYECGIDPDFYTKRGAYLDENSHGFYRHRVSKDLKREWKNALAESVTN